MKVVGLTGGVGSGKSLVASTLQERCGALLLITDQMGHLAMEPGSQGYQQIINRFGDTVLGIRGEINRGVLAEKIFQDDVAREDLNEIIHPIVLAQIEQVITEHKREEGMIVLESALLFEAHCEQYCDEIWYVRVALESRIKRLAESRGYTEEKTHAIMEQQMKEEDYASRSDVIIWNDGTKEELEEQVLSRVED